MAKYNPSSGQALIEVAGSLYKDWSTGITDLLLNNPGIDINSIDLFGAPLDYSLELIARVPRRPSVIQGAEKTRLFRAHKLQSHFDLSLQIYGDLSRIGEILKNINDINGEIPLGTAFVFPEQSDPQAQYFSDRIIATDIEFHAFTVDTILITVDSTLVTADQTIY